MFTEVECGGIMSSNWCYASLFSLGYVWVQALCTCVSKSISFGKGQSEPSSSSLTSFQQLIFFRKCLNNFSYATHSLLFQSDYVTLEFVKSGISSVVQNVFGQVTCSNILMCSLILQLKGQDALLWQCHELRQRKTILKKRLIVPQLFTWSEKSKPLSFSSCK